jgi:hypothetical protein
VLQVLVAMKVLTPGKFVSVAEESTAIQDLLVCLEMGFIFSPLQLYAFTHADYIVKRKAD